MTPVTPDTETETESREARVERGVFRDGMIGAIVGVLVLVPVWAGLVALAVRNSGTALWPAVVMGAGVGVVAGVFMGGWAGTLVGASKLERFEHETRPPAPPAGSGH